MPIDSYLFSRRLPFTCIAFAFVVSYRLKLKTESTDTEGLNKRLVEKKALQREKNIVIEESLSESLWR